MNSNSPPLAGQSELADVVSQQLQHIQSLQDQLESRNKSFQLLLKKVEELQVNSTKSRETVNKSQINAKPRSRPEIKNNGQRKASTKKSRDCNTTRAASEPLPRSSPKKSLHQMVTSDTPEGFERTK
ncbi:hypothetical protein O181_126770, partial [Austropuccinia psidii MF-1]|nr:hypothetical protein [Austropuccinia psidii MF-1]